MRGRCFFKRASSSKIDRTMSVQVSQGLRSLYYLKQTGKDQIDRMIVRPPGNISDS